MKWFFLGIIFLIYSRIYGAFDHKLLNHCSLDDKICMRWFAKGLIETEQVLHVLFFETKAVAWGGCILQGRDKRLYDVQFARGWSAFKKHEQIFPHPNYLIQAYITEDDHDLCGHYKILHTFVINKKTLEKCLSQYFHIFREVLGADFNSIEFVKALEMGMPLNTLLQHDEMLLGILLGFGEESASAYKNKNALESPPGPPIWRADYCGVDVARPPRCRISPVAFMGNPRSIEVRRLIEIYAAELEIFWKKYKNEDPLTIFLQGLMEEATDRQSSAY